MTTSTSGSARPARAAATRERRAVPDDQAPLDDHAAVEDRARAYLDRFAQLVTGMDASSIAIAVGRLRRARDEGATIFVAGNGGSASTASHLVNDLSKAARGPHAPTLRVVGLADNIAWLTALANDEGYERVFAGQLENLARPGDVLLLISASGNSPNLLRAVEHARDAGVETIALLGFDGGALRSMVDHAVWVETEHGAYGFAENAHTVIADLITACLARDARTPR